MEFLQHFLPGQPTETNEQTSGGALVSQEFEAGAWAGQFGAQIEAMHGSLLEIQNRPTVGSDLSDGHPPLLGATTTTTSIRSWLPASTT